MKKQYDIETLKGLLHQGILSKEEFDKITVGDSPALVRFNKECVKDFNKALKGQSKHTQRAYSTSVKKVIEKLHGEELESMDEIDIEVSIEKISEVLHSLLEDGYGYDTIRRYRSALSFYHETMIFGKSAIRKVDLSDVKRNKAEYYFFREDDIFSIAEQRDLRSKLMIIVFFETGVRRQELIEIKKSDIDYENKTVNVYDAQNEGYRTVYISDETCKMIREYIRDWENEVEDINDKRRIKALKTGTSYSGITVSEYLFQSIRSDQISYSTIFKALKDASFEYFYKKEIMKGSNKEEALEIAEEMSSNFHTESIRNSKIISMLSRGDSIDKIQVVLGIKNHWEVKKFLKTAHKLYPERFRPD